jgi:uncharacterized membrane protein YphA (DoxX/SURF4 family)
MKRLGFFVGKLIVGFFYLYNGVNHFANLKDVAGYAASKGVPLPEVAVAGSGLLLLVGGILFLSGIYTDIAVAALVLFFVPVTFMMHDFWAVGNDMKMVELVNFSKNLALMGSALLFLMIPKPWPMGIINPNQEQQDRE